MRYLKDRRELHEKGDRTEGAGYARRTDSSIFLGFQEVAAWTRAWKRARLRGEWS
jgi:hypothetical protein